MGKEHPLRGGVIKVIRHYLFDKITTSIILLNCILLTLYRPTEEHDSKWNSTLDNIDKFFLAAFTLELLLNVVAMGPWRYVTDPWNFMDFVVVVSGYAELAAGPGSSVSALRTFRVLRPLRTINSMPGLKLLVNTILGALPLMGNVLVLWVYLFLIFGILGTQMFGGELSKRCVPLTEYGVDLIEAAELTANQTLAYGERQSLIDEHWLAGNLPAAVDFSNATEYDFCTVGPKIGWNGHYCDDTQACVHIDDPDDGKTSFNNLLWSMLTVFVVVTLETWTTIMYATMRTTSGWALIFYYLVIFLGSFFMVNLALAVIADIYEQNVDQANEEQKELSMLEQMHLVAIEQKERRERLLELRSSRSAKKYLEKEASKSTPSCVIKFGLMVRRQCAAIYDSPVFTNLTTALIMGNTLVLSMEYHNMPASYASGLEVTNEVLTWLFISEMLVKLIGLGFVRYWKDNFNRFDTLVNIVSVVELYGTNNGSLSALRAFRILRVMKIAGTSESLKLFIETLTKTVAELGNFALIVALISFIFALLGMQTFGDQFHFEVCESDFNEVLGREVVVCEIDSPRSNFDTVLWAFVTVLQIFTGEDWNSVMYSGMKAKGDAAALYFVFLVILGNYIVMNLFIAILLSSFSSHREERYDALGVMPTVDGGVAVQLRSEGRSKTSQGTSATAASSGTTCDIPLEVCAVKVEADAVATGTSNGVPSSPTDIPLEVCAVKVEADAVATGTSNGVTSSPTDGVTFDAAATKAAAEEEPNAKSMEKPNQIKPLEEFTGDALFIFSKDHPIRKLAYRTITAPLFDVVILSCIVLSSIMMACEAPALEDNEIFMDVVLYVDYVVTVIFVIEMCLKLIALGLMGEKSAYLTSGWNVLDGLIVTVSVLSLALANLDLEWVRALRVLRVLRPLRMISRIPELRVVVNALLASFPGLGNVLLVMSLNFVIFGILGMSLFRGKFYMCNDDDVAGRAECVGTYFDKFDIEREREWANQEPNFDNIFFAIGALFEMSTSEGWVDLMHMGVDATGVDSQPKQNNSEWAVIYFAAFMLSTFFFLLNLFIGIIMDNFAQLREASTASSVFMSDRQRMWVEVNKKLAKVKLVRAVDRPNNWRRLFYDLVSSAVFENVVLGGILINVLFMATSHSYEPGYWTDVVEIANRFFTYFFAAEMALKLVGLLPQNYVRDGWNLFDGFVVTVSLVAELADVGAGANVLRIFRLARALRLVKRFKSLMLLFQTLLQALPILMNVGGLLFLLLFVFSVLGVQLFGKVNHEQESLNADANFSNFGQAFNLLFRMSTGEVWNGVMRDVMTQPEDGVCSKEAGDCGLLVAPVYFFAFVISGSFVMLNLFLAVVLENYDAVVENAKEEAEDETAITQEDIEDFNARWAKFDPAATGWILVKDLDALLITLPQPLGMLPKPAADEEAGKGAKLSPSKLLQLQVQLKINVYIYPATAESYCSYSDVLQKATMYSFGLTVDDLPAQALELMEREQDSARRKTMRKLAAKKAADAQRDVDAIRMRARGLERVVENSGPSKGLLSRSQSGRSNQSFLSKVANGTSEASFSDDEMRKMALAQSFGSRASIVSSRRKLTPDEIKRVIDEVRRSLVADPDARIEPHELVLSKYSTQHVTAISVIQAYLGGWTERRLNTEHAMMLQDGKMLERVSKGLDQLGFVLKRMDV